VKFVKFLLPLGSNFHNSRKKEHKLSNSNSPGSLLAGGCASACLAAASSSVCSETHYTPSSAQSNITQVSTLYIYAVDKVLHSQQTTLNRFASKVIQSSHDYLG
jgi:organic hydroperoxide reductase OsmC/OhrA